MEELFINIDEFNSKFFINESLTNQMQRKELVVILEQKWYYICFKNMNAVERSELIIFSIYINI